MSSDWRDLLDRLIEGETLSDVEARELADALAAPPGSREAAEWLGFEAALRERLAPDCAESVALSRERLLAKALLREKSAFAAQHSGPASLPKVSDLSLPKVSDLREGIPCAPSSSEFPAYPPEGAIREWPSGGGAVKPSGGSVVKPSGGKSLGRRTIAVAAVALIAVAAALLAGGRLFKHRADQAREGAEHYAEPEASGEFEVLSPGRSTAQGGAIRRGDRLVAGSSGARLTAGGYCDLAIDPKSEVVVHGEPGKEEIELMAGRVVSRITPARGQFRVRTPLGSLEVVGTEFVTSVVPPSSEEGEEDMGRLRKAAVVTVLVVSGTIAYHFGDSVGLLSAGMNQAFGAEEGGGPALPDSLNGFKGLLLGTITSKGERDFVLKIDRIAVPWKESKAENPDAAVGKEAKVVVAAGSRLAMHLGHTLAGLKVGDQIIVEAFHLGGELLTVAELLRKAGVPATEGERREGDVRRPEGGGEPGHGAQLIPREGEGVRREGEAAIPRGSFGGSNGLLVGTLLRKGEEGFVLKVEKATPAPGKTLAEHPEALVGKEVEVTVMREGRLHPQRSRDLAELKPGDRVEVGVRPTEGNAFAVVSVLRKAQAPAEGGGREGEGIRREGEGERREGERLIPREGEGRPRSEGERREGEGVVRREGEQPALREGFGGFQGLLVGTIVDKGENQFTLKVEKVGRSWHSSRAKSPESLVGKEVKLVVRGPEGAARRLAGALAERQVGDRIEVGAQHIEENVLSVIETLRKVSAEGERREGEGVRREGEGERREGERLIRREGEGEHREGERLVPREGERVIRREGEGREGAPAPAPAEAIQGFRGMLQGTIQEKVEDGIVLRIEKVAKVWQSSQSKNPEGLAGRTVRIAVKREEGGAGLAGALGALKAGDRVVVGAIHTEGDRLTASEMLRKAE